MVIREFKALIEKREEWVASSKKNRFNFEDILAGIYNDPSHFIFEILQNSEDANAKEVSFYLFNDRLEIVHDGKDFNYDNVDGITGIGISTKRDDINSIGKFGVGFKSVFAVTKTPVIQSGDYNFRIEDFVIPRIINEKHKVKETKIILPFNHPTRDQNSVYELVKEKLKSINLHSFLFLGNIERIKWQADEYGTYTKLSKNIDGIQNAKRVVVESVADGDKEAAEYLVFARPVQFDDKQLKVEVAYRIEKDDDGKDRIVQENESELVVFFPTAKETQLNFLIQGPYKTTPNRENIPLSDEQNQILLDETAILVADTISAVKALGLLNVSFLNIMPIEKANLSKQIYATIYGKVKEKLMSEALLPASDGNFVAAKDALLARGRDLVEILDEEDIKSLFGKNKWLNQEITADKTRSLRDYLLDDLKIMEVDFPDFARRIVESFIKRKSDRWLADFYARLLELRSLWTKVGYSANSGILREKPIIRLSDNSHIAPFNSKGKIQVYLPTNTDSEYKTVKKNLLKNEDAAKFLTELGLSRPDIFSEIREFIIPRYKETDNKIQKARYFDDIGKIFSAFKSKDNEKREELISDLKDLNIVLGEDSVSGESGFYSPSDVYLPTEELKEYFRNFDTAIFASHELYEKFKDSQELLNDLLISLGCNDCPRRLQIESKLTYGQKSELRNGPCSREISDIDYDYDGLDNFLEELTPDRSAILWRLLLKSLSGISKWNKKDFFYAKYSWFYYNRYTKNYESIFLQALRNTNWLFNNDNEIIKPSDVALSDLPDLYMKEDDSVESLCEVLNFKLDDIKRIEEKTGKKVVLFSEKEYIEWMKQKAAGESDSDNGKPDDEDGGAPHC